MWKCIRCNVETPFNAVEPSIDSFGIYFLCPHCGRRNKLVCVKRGRYRYFQQTGT